MLRQDRRQLASEAERAIERQVELAMRELSAAARRHGEVRFLVAPSRRDIADAARARTPSESQVHIANATMRRLSVHVAPGDCPDVTALLDEGCVTWSRGRTGQVTPYRGAPLATEGHGVRVNAQAHRTIRFGTGELRSANGAPARLDQAIAWSKSLSGRTGG